MKHTIYDDYTGKSGPLSLVCWNRIARMEAWVGTGQPGIRNRTTIPCGGYRDYGRRMSWPTAEDKTKQRALFEMHIMSRGRPGLRGSVGSGERLDYFSYYCRYYFCRCVPNNNNYISNDDISLRLQAFSWAVALASRALCVRSPTGGAERRR